MPLGTLEQNRWIDLRPYASVRHGVLYVSHPSAEKVWIPLGSLPSMTSARATATQMLEKFCFMYIYRYGNPACMLYKID